MKLSIVIPAYNEETNLRDGKLRNVLNLVAANPGAELVMVDDGSTDATSAIIAQQIAGYKDCYCYPIGHSGKAAALLTGIKMSMGDLILTADLDQAVPITEGKFLQSAIESDGFDIAIGSRGYRRPGAPLGRDLLSIGQVILKRLLLRMPYMDTQCGFKMWRRPAVMHIIEHLVIYNPKRLAEVNRPDTNSGFDLEMLLVAQRLGYSVAEVPVRWQYQVSSRVSFARDARRGMLDLCRILAADAAGLYPSQKSIPFTKKLFGVKQNE